MLRRGSGTGTPPGGATQEPTPSQLEEVVRLLSWFAQSETPEIHERLARVAAAKLWRVLFVMPTGSAKPTKALLRKLRIEAATDPMSIRAVQNLRVVLQSSSQTATIALERLSRAAIDQAGQEAFIKIAIHADQTDKDRGWNHLVAFENSEISEAARILEVCNQASAERLQRESGMTTFDALEVIASIADTAAVLYL